MNCECEKLKKDINAYQAHIENKFNAEMWLNPSFNKFIQDMKNRIFLRMRQEIQIAGAADYEMTIKELRNKIAILEQWNCELEVDLQFVRKKQEALKNNESIKGINER